MNFINVTTSSLSCMLQTPASSTAMPGKPTRPHGGACRSGGGRSTGDLLSCYVGKYTSWSDTDTVSFKMLGHKGFFAKDLRKCNIQVRLPGEPGVAE